MKIIKPGPFVQTSRNGMTVNLDQELSVQQLDVLTGLMAHHGYEPNDVTEARFEGDGVVFRMSPLHEALA